MTDVTLYYLDFRCPKCGATEWGVISWEDAPPRFCIECNTLMEVIDESAIMELDDKDEEPQ